MSNGESGQRRSEQDDAILRVFSKNREYSFDQSAHVDLTRTTSVFAPNTDRTSDTNMAEQPQPGSAKETGDEAWGAQVEVFDKKSDISEALSESKAKLEQNSAELTVKIDTKEPETNLEEPDESVMNDVLRNFEPVGEDTKSKLKQILSREYLEVDSVGSESKRDSLFKAKR